MVTKDHPLGFIADETVGKLAKWLRILGFDTCYDPELPRRSIAFNSRDDRIWLTRSRYHYKKPSRIKILRLESDDAMQQLVEVVTALGLTLSAIVPCSRCIRCNAPTIAVSKALAFGKVPDYIWHTQAAFYQCGQCRRIYWPGSHYKRIKATIAFILHEQQKVSDGRC
jgi:uncharacterized protein with PIN domain